MRSQDNKPPSARTQQRTNKRLGIARPSGRPTVALDSAFREMYVKVKMRQLTKQDAADELGCSVRTLERKFKAIKKQQLYDLTNSRRTTTNRSV